jgi:hypothetical protein
MLMILRLLSRGFCGDPTIAAERPALGMLLFAENYETAFQDSHLAAYRSA